MTKLFAKPRKALFARSVTQRLLLRSAEEYLHSDRVKDTSCLITDVQMPGMNGVELQERLIADGRRQKSSS